MEAPGWRRYAAALTDQLGRAGVLRDPAWRQAMLSTPRHVFVPRYYTHNRQIIDANKRRHQAQWLADAYADRPLVTKVSRRSGVALSSASQPTVVVTMLELLEVHDDDRVLEIGTGTGYNAALLCARLGDDHVVSVDIDADLVSQAHQRLAALGHHPVLITADGADGAPAYAPFDRIIATCAIPAIPTAWLEQLAPGGRIVAPADESHPGRLFFAKRSTTDQLNTWDEDRGIYFLPLRHS